MPQRSTVACLFHVVSPSVPVLTVATVLLAATSLWAEPDPPPARPIIILIGGNHSDPSPAQLESRAGRGGNSGLWRLKGDLHSADDLPTEYFNWNGTRAGHIDAPDPPGAAQIARRIRQLTAQRPGAAVVLVGNSWGGHTAWQVCHLLAGGRVDERLGTQQSIDAYTGELRSSSSRQQSQQSDLPVITPRRRHPASRLVETSRGTSSEKPGQAALIAVDLLVLLDASSFGRSKAPMPTFLPANVRRAVNYHTRNSFGWCGWLQDERLCCIDLGDPQHGYLVEGGPQYDSVLNWPAHVAAEWDERIHAAIREQIAAATK